MFRRDPVASVLRKDFVEVRLHTDHPDAALKAQALALQEQYIGDPSLPNYIVVDPADRSAHGRFAGACRPASSDEEVFVEFLEKGLREVRG